MGWTERKGEELQKDKGPGLSIGGPRAGRHLSHTSTCNGAKTSVALKREQTCGGQDMIFPPLSCREAAIQHICHCRPHNSSYREKVRRREEEKKRSGEEQRGGELPQRRLIDLASPFHAQDEIISDCGGEKERGEDCGEQGNKERKEKGRKKKGWMIQRKGERRTQK
ncbi:hypothetical protein F7725_026124 [Dissostichus mawsoni]|uniref:Uncharacterized protein n=1 Tax=Dissostichus mawsoni TaxID=36200 RepID=A0A7J5X749_DISMA|nr:hypothetical protein F7725_026124 [Dissostichus mawsoni]